MIVPLSPRIAVGAQILRAQGCPRGTGRRTGSRSSVIGVVEAGPSPRPRRTEVPSAPKTRVPMVWLGNCVTVVDERARPRPRGAGQPESEMRALTTQPSAVSPGGDGHTSLSVSGSPQCGAVPPAGRRGCRPKRCRAPPGSRGGVRAETSPGPSCCRCSCAVGDHGRGRVVDPVEHLTTAALLGPNTRPSLETRPMSAGSVRRTRRSRGTPTAGRIGSSSRPRWPAPRAGGGARRAAQVGVGTSRRRHRRHLPGVPANRIRWRAVDFSTALSRGCVRSVRTGAVRTNDTPPRRRRRRGGRRTSADRR